MFLYIVYDQMKILINLGRLSINFYSNFPTMPCIRVCIDVIWSKSCL